MQQAQAAAVMLQAMADDGDSWAAKARSGLYSVLASRTGTEQRHAALRLAAAMLELVPSTWLTGPAPPLVHLLRQQRLLHTISWWLWLHRMLLLLLLLHGSFAYFSVSAAGRYADSSCCSEHVTCTFKAAAWFKLGHAVL